MSEQITEEPLVSIIVITYNSSKYVIETLESCKNQSYSNIEIIISDDASNDNTVDICKKWLQKNKNGFKRTKLITENTNTGIPANCNRGVENSKGKWVKLIAGDDVLLESCISLNLDFATKTNHKIVASNVEEFTNEGKIWEWNIPNHFLELKSSKQQFLYFLTGIGYLAGGALFINKRLLERIGGFDERYPLVEDRPFLLKATYNGFFIGSLDAQTIRHRRHSSGLTTKIYKKSKIIPEYLFQVHQCIKFYARISNKLLYLLNAYWHLGFFRLINLTNSIFLNKLRKKFDPIKILV